MNGTEIERLIERLVRDANDGLWMLNDNDQYGSVESQILHVLWGVTPESAATIRRLVLCGKIAATPAEIAITADDPEWAAAVRCVLYGVRGALHGISV